jgi:hypothetical protein
MVRVRMLGQPLLERSKNIEPNRDIAESHVELLPLGVLFKL